MNIPAIPTRSMVSFIIVTPAIIIISNPELAVVIEDFINSTDGIYLALAIFFAYMVVMLTQKEGREVLKSFFKGFSLRRH